MGKYKYYFGGNKMDYYNTYNSYPYYRPPEKIRCGYAELKGGPLAPELFGYVFFTDTNDGTDVYIEVNGLPAYKPSTNGTDPIGPHGFHIHENGNCTVGSETEPFKAAGEHWNPTNQPHGNHAGDFPVLFSNNGYGRMAFFTNKFRIKDVIGKGIIIHQSPDDYRTQPAGDAGKRLACGVIRALYY